MPAVVGQIISTLYDGQGELYIRLTINFTDGTGALRNDTISTTDGDKFGALVVDNVTGSPKRVTVRDENGDEIHAFNVPANGAAVTVAQLATVGVTNRTDFAGVGFDLT